MQFLQLHIFISSLEIIFAVSQNTMSAANDDSSFFNAVKVGDLATVKRLLKRGVEVNKKHNGKSALFLCAEMGCYYEVAQELIKYGALVDSPFDLESRLSMRGCTPLHIAVIGRHRTFVSLLLKSGANINAKTLVRNTPLHYTVSILSEESRFEKKKYNLLEDKFIAEMLLCKGAEINTKNFDGETALHLAAGKGSEQVLQLLLKWNADVNVEDKFGNRPLHCIAVSGIQSEMANLLIGKGAEVDAANVKGETPLHLAAKNAHTNVVDLLLEHKANVNIKDETGNTPLHLLPVFNEVTTDKSIIYNSVGLANRLVSKGIKVSRNQETALHLAAQSVCLEIVELLLKRGANVNSKDHNGNSPLHCTFLHKADIKKSTKVRCGKIFEMLMNYGADVYTINGKEKNMIHVAAESGYVESVKFLLNYDFDLNKTDKTGYTPLHCTFLRQSVGVEGKEIAKMLINKGADFNVKTEAGSTALHLASHSGCVEAVEFLLELVEVNSRNNIGWSPLHYAATSGHTEIIKLISESGCDVNAKTKNGWTPFHLVLQVFKDKKLVSRFRFDAILELLEQGADINLENAERETPFQYVKGPLAPDTFKLAEVVIGHVMKLIALNFYVSEENMKWLNNESFHNDPHLNYMHGQCGKEIEIMKHKKIDGATNIVFFDLLTKSRHILEKYVRNKNIIELHNSKKIEEFNIYGQFLNFRLSQAIKRKNLIVKCVEIFCLFTIQLSREVIESVCDFLSDTDMKNMISAYCSEL